MQKIYNRQIAISSRIKGYGQNTVDNDKQSQWEIQICEESKDTTRVRYATRHSKDSEFIHFEWKDFARNYQRWAA